MTLDIKNKQIMTTSSLEPRLEEVSLEADFLKHQFVWKDGCNLPKNQNIRAN